MNKEASTTAGRIGPLQFVIYSIALATALVSSIASAQQTNPLASDPRAAQAGGVIFRAQCATCHGADAKGISSIDAPDLTLMWTQPGMNEARVFSRIQDGVPGSIMPAHTFPDAEIWMLVSYLRSVAVAGSTAAFTGNAEKGGRLFAALCSECHRAGSSGGSLGPNLRGITQRRSQLALRNSVRDPSASIGRGYKPIVFSTRDEAGVSGIIKGEDAFSIQILDGNQRLRGFAKSDLLRSDREVGSLMPVFPERELSDTQLDDILSYLDEQR
jgi:putative heme-binding domain-containing protein